ncbi:MAG: RecX family transcriptional regulator [Pyrinomonadaceae bacterium]|nr:RecX family transcriptional regulator [Pyrinomonadaceae bacterium]
MRRLRRKRTKTADGEAPPGKPMTPEERRHHIFQRAIKLLAARSRSVAELSELLLQTRGATQNVVDEVLARLREYGYLDDERFAFGYASFKLRQRPLGRQRLKRDLAMKKVDKAVIDEALDLVFAEVSEEEQIDRAIEKRTRVRGRPKNRLQAKGLFDHLMRQGFPFELVAEKVRAASKTDLTAIDDEP